MEGTAQTKVAHGGQKPCVSACVESKLLDTLRKLIAGHVLRGRDLSVVCIGDSFGCTPELLGFPRQVEHAWFAHLGRLVEIAGGLVDNVSGQGPPVRSSTSRQEKNRSWFPFLLKCGSYADN